jgi:hypothetical protein
MQFRQGEQREQAERDGQRHEQAGETGGSADLSMLETKARLGILEDFLNGRITNDKFCRSRYVSLRVMWS